MKLNQLRTNKQKGLNKVLETRYGFSVDFEKMTPRKAFKLSKVLGESLNKIRYSHGVHTAEKNPKYMECLMVKENIDQWIQRKNLTEGEIEQAEAVLAAKDIVTRLQKMYEDVASIVTQDIPPLSDVIRDQMGSEQSSAFTTEATASLQTLQEQLSVTREAMDNAARVLAGEEDSAGDMDMGAGDDLDMDMGDDLDMDAGDDLGAELDMSDDADGFDGADAAIGGDLEMGRELR